MSVTNDFLPFATGASANVESQGSYATDTLRTNGNQPGVAVSALNNKALRQGTFIASQLAQFVANTTSTNAQDNTTTAQFLAQLQAAVQFFPPVLTTLASSTGTFNLTYIFFIATPTVAPASSATYTDSNSTTFTVTVTETGNILRASGAVAPAVSGTLTKASGTGDSTITYYATRAPISLDVEMVGGGGGGAGSGTVAGAGGTGGTGGNTTFGTTLLVADGGVGGTAAGDGGVGGSASLGSGPAGLALSGGSGGACSFEGSGVSVASCGADGAASPFGGSGGGGVQVVAGQAAITNTGSGGGGGGSASSNPKNSGSGGGAGGYVKALITSLLSTYGWAVGAAGAAGTAGTTGFVGGAGGSGVILVTTRYQ